MCDPCSAIYYYSIGHRGNVHLRLQTTDYTGGGLLLCSCYLSLSVNYLPGMPRRSLPLRRPTTMQLNCREPMERLTISMPSIWLRRGRKLKTTMMIDLYCRSVNYEITEALLVSLWHHTVVCLSVCLSVRLCTVALRYIQQKICKALHILGWNFTQ